MASSKVCGDTPHLFRWIGGDDVAALFERTTIGPMWRLAHVFIHMRRGTDSASRTYYVLWPQEIVEAAAALRLVDPKIGIAAAVLAIAGPMPAGRRDLPLRFDLVPE